MEVSFLAWRRSGRSFSYRGQSIFFQSAQGTGSGPTLLCIHGLPTASWDWSRLWPMLQKRCARVLAPDMLGFGWSDKPVPYDYSIFDQADLHEALLRAEGIARFSVLAHDYGVTVAQELLARHEERRVRGDHSLVLERIVFLNGGLFPETHRPLLIQRMMLTPLGPLLSRVINERAFGHSLSKTFGRDTRPSRRELHEFWQLLEANGGKPMFYRLFHYMTERRAHRERWVGALQHSAVPLRLINGAADPVSGEHVVTRYRELVPNPDTVLIPGIGHYPHVEAPDVVWRALESMLPVQ